MDNATALTVTTTATLGRPAITASQLVELWERDLDSRVRRGDLSADTQTTYKTGVTRLRRVVGEGLLTLDRQAVDSWRSAEVEAGRKLSSVRVWLAGIRDFSAWVVSVGGWPVNPCIGLRVGRRSDSRSHRRDPLTDDEAERLLDLSSLSEHDRAVSVRDRAVVNLLLYTGARSIELHRADLADLATEGQDTILRVIGKGRTREDSAGADSRVVIASLEARTALFDWLAVRGPAPGPLFTSLSNRSKGDRLSRRSLRELVKTAMHRAGVVSARKTTHSLRHTAVSAAIRGGASLMQAQAMARHKSVDTTTIYYRQIDRVENAAERRISYRRPKDPQ